MDSSYIQQRPMIRYIQHTWIGIAHKLLCAARLGLWFACGAAAGYVVKSPLIIIVMLLSIPSTPAHRTRQAVESEGNVSLSMRWQGWWVLYAGEGCVDDSWFRRQKKNLVALERVGVDLGGVVVQYCRITDQSMPILGRLKSLRWCSLAGGLITDRGVGELRGLKRLEWLDLQGTKVTDNVFKHLEAMPQLKSVNLSNTGVTRAAIERFEKAHPKVSVNYW